METKQINLYKADGVIKPESVQSVKILIINALEPDKLTIKELAVIYKAEGYHLAETLLKTLPGGTVDMMLKRLLEKRASYFVIPFES